MVKCATPYCRGVRTPKGHSPYCAKCRTRRFRDRWPLNNVYNNLRKRARQRGHAFVLSYADYERFAVETGYAALKGKEKHSLSIDRIRPELGYAIENIRAVTLSVNSRLRFAPLPDYLRAEMELAERAAA